MMVSFSILIYIEDENEDDTARKINGLQTQASNLETEMRLEDMSNTSSLTKKGKLPPLKKNDNEES
jgi:hypothetical protein